MHNHIGDKSVIVKGGFLDGWKVKSGGRAQQLRGDAKRVLINTTEELESGVRKNYVELQAKWNL